MKSEELMIGDWVIFPNSIEKVQEISYVCGKGYCASFAASATLFLIPIDKLKPIPLTPEILEKNGWEYNNYNNETEYEEEYYVDENGFDVHINGKGFEVRCIDAVNIQLKYLHELQHILRLCGIEKEIVL